MSYKLIEVVKKISGQEQQSLYDYADVTTLLATMNNDFGAQVKDDSTASIYCFGIDNETGEKIDSLYYSVENSFFGDDTEPVAVDTSIRNRVYTHNDYENDNIAAYDTERLAIGNYHTKIAGAMRKEECDHAITILIDGRGNFAEFSNWIRPE